MPVSVRQLGTYANLLRDKMDDFVDIAKVRLPANLRAKFMEQALANVIASQNFEGLYPGAEIKKDLEDLIAGKLTAAEVEANIYERVLALLGDK